MAEMNGKHKAHSGRNGSNVGNDNEFTVTTVSLPDRLHRSVIRWASQENKTANELIREIILQGVKTHEDDPKREWAG